MRVFLDRDAEELFYKYEYPIAMSLAKWRGYRKSELEELFSCFFRGEPTSENLKRACWEELGMLLSRDSPEPITTSEVRVFFLESFGETVVPARVEHATRVDARVVTPFGERIVSNRFTGRLEEGEWVTVSLFFAIERVTREFGILWWEQKKGGSG